MKTCNGFVTISVMLVVLVGTAYSQKRTAVPAEDCIPYDANRLEIIDEGKKGWLLSDNGGSHRMAMFDNESDAALGLEIAGKYSWMCFIGRNNVRANRKTYILQYWK